LRALSFIVLSLHPKTSAGSGRRSPYRPLDLSYRNSGDQQEADGMMPQLPCTGREQAVIRRVTLFVALFLAGTAASSRAADPVRVLAAVTLKPAMDAIAEKYSGGEVLLVYGPSPTLAKQIENGVPADIFFSADTIWMDELTQHHLIKPETNIDFVSNHLVLIGRKGSGNRVTIAPGFPLAKLVGAGPLAMCDPDSHPAGRYGKASLVALDVWQSVEHKIARADSPLLAVTMVARGDVPFAIVFATDAATDGEVEIVGTFPDDTHPKIGYPVAVLTQSHNPDALQFLDYLKSAAALAMFQKFGYVTLGIGD
jgi:molybdate transport system substrate-binding protein